MVDGTDRGRLVHPRNAFLSEVGEQRREHRKAAW
jgi:hypothetical protein